MGERGGSAARVVMVVEDYEDTRALMKLVLEMKGYEVLEASNGQEAVDVALHNVPELILMDLSMPVLDGVEATRRLRADAKTARTPIVAVTAHGDNDWRQRAVAAGATDFVPKPMDFDRLDRILRAYVPA